MTEYAPDQNFKHPVCRGSWAFGNNCKVCERCLDTHPNRGGTQLLTNPKHTDTSRSGDLIDIEPVAYRYGFDGYGWQYIDNGSGSDWTTRHPDAEPLYAHSPADRIKALEAEVERLREAVAGLMEIAEMAMPDTYFATDSRVNAARAALAGDSHATGN